MSPRISVPLSPSVIPTHTVPGNSPEKDETPKITNAVAAELKNDDISTSASELSDANYIDLASKLDDKLDSINLPLDSTNTKSTDSLVVKKVSNNKKAIGTTHIEDVLPAAEENLHNVITSELTSI